MLSFNQIPIDIRTPGQFIEVDNSRAIQGLPVVSHKILVIGQRLPAGAIQANVVSRMFGARNAVVNYGRGSMIAGMVAALKLANNATDTYAIALDDLGAGTAATGTYVFTGTATKAGLLNLYLGGVRVQLNVTNGMLAADVATAAAAAINANLDLPVTAGAAAGTVTVTFRHKGEIGNSYNLRQSFGFGEAIPSGLAVAINAMAGGAGNPDIAAVIAAIGDDQFDTIVMPYTDAPNLTALEAELERRWGPMVQREGHAFAAVSGTLSQITTLGDSRNSAHLTIMGAGKSPTAPWEFAAVAAAVDAAEPDPARPRQTLVLTGVVAPWETDRPTRSERDLLLHDGISTFVVDASGLCRIERLITTYQVDANDNPDQSYLDVETMRTLAYLRTTTRLRIAARFPRHKLADDGTVFSPGQAIATPSLIRMELLHLFREWELAGLAEGFDQFKAELVVERSASDPNRIDALIPPNTVNQLRVFAAQLQFIK